METIKYKFQIGDKVRSKAHPELAGEILKIEYSNLTNRIMYILDWRGQYLAEELELNKFKS